MNSIVNKIGLYKTESDKTSCDACRKRVYT